MVNKQNNFDTCSSVSKPYRCTIKWAWKEAVQGNTESIASGRGRSRLRLVTSHRVTTSEFSTDPEPPSHQLQMRRNKIYVPGFLRLLSEIMEKNYLLLLAEIKHSSTLFKTPTTCWAVRRQHQLLPLQSWVQWEFTLTAALRETKPWNSHLRRIHQRSGVS